MDSLDRLHAGRLLYLRSCPRPGSRLPCDRTSRRDVPARMGPGCFVEDTDKDASSGTCFPSTRPGAASHRGFRLMGVKSFVLVCDRPPVVPSAFERSRALPSLCCASSCPSRDIFHNSLLTCLLTSLLLSLYPSALCYCIYKWVTSRAFDWSQAQRTLQ
jgi:hypothetical protein